MFVFGWYLVLLTSLPMEPSCAEHSLEEDVDQLIKKELGDEPFRRRMNNAKDNFIRLMEAEREKQNITQNFQNNTEFDPKERLNGSEILYRMKMEEVQTIFNLKVNRLDQFKKDIDGLSDLRNTVEKLEPKINGRRASDASNVLLESMLLDAQDAMKQIAVPSPPNPQEIKSKSLRWPGSYLGLGDYKQYYPRWLVNLIKQKCMTTIWAFVYRTQYYVTLAQTMRRRYIKNVRYRLGFCYALMHQLIKEQRILVNSIWSTYWNWKEQMGMMHLWSFYVLEKVQRLETDIRDIIQYIKILEYTRKRIEDPDYYKYFPSSTGRYSG